MNVGHLSWVENYTQFWDLFMGHDYPGGAVNQHQQLNAKDTAGLPLTLQAVRLDKGVVEAGNELGVEGNSVRNEATSA